MASLAELGLGTSLTVGANDITEMTDIGEFGVTRADLDVTNHDSSGNAEEFIAGLIQGGEVPVSCNLTMGTGQAAIVTDCIAGTVRPCLITLPNTAASTFSFYAYVKSYKVKPDLKGVMKFSFILKVANRAPIWTV